MRTSTIIRKTNETDITLSLNLDGNGTNEINTGCGFLNHMLTLFAVHSRYDLTVNCIGDTDVDFHHSVEDIGIALGKAFKEAVGDKKGINRYGFFILPMDESLILSSVDISGRKTLCYNVDIPTEKVGSFDTELVLEFFTAFVNNAEITLHINKMSGINSHHIIEGVFKSVARSLSVATSLNPDLKNVILSSKGVL